MTAVRCVLVLIGCLVFVGPALAAPDNFARSVANVLESEGCTYENHPKDPGGPTKCGITIYDCRKYIKHNCTAADVRNITPEVAKAIYKKRYWDDPCVMGDQLPRGLDYSVFDFGVNSGVGRSGSTLRRLLGFNGGGCVVDDGVLRKLASADITMVIHRFNALRLAFLKRLRTWPYFGRGWGSRVKFVDRISAEMYSAPRTLAQAGILVAPIIPFAYEVAPQSHGKAWAQGDE